MIGMVKLAVPPGYENFTVAGKRDSFSGERGLSGIGAAFGVALAAATYVKTGSVVGAIAGGIVGGVCGGEMSTYLENERREAFLRDAGHAPRWRTPDRPVSQYPDGIVPGL